MSAPTETPVGTAASPAPEAPTGPLAWPTRAWRAIGAAGALVLLLSLFVEWKVDQRDAGDVTLDAWALYVGTDVLLAGLAVAAVVGAALPRRAGALVSLGAAGLGLLVAARAFTLTGPSLGSRLALLGALAAVVAAAVRLVPESRRAPLAALLLRADRVSARVVASPALLVGCAALLAWSTFPLRTLQPGGGTDGSWIAGLHLAARQDLDFGTELVFTYGPLGWLTVPRLYFPETATLGFAYVAAVHLALAVTLLWAARRSFGLPVALVLVTVVLALLRLAAPDETTQLAVLSVVFALCVAALREPRIGASRAWLALVAAGAAFTAVHALVKLNTGLLCVVLVAVTAVAAAPARRRLVSAGVFAGAFVVSLLALWALEGQGLDALPAYVRRSFEVISGFTEAQYSEEPERAWEYLAGAIVALVVAATALTATEGWSRTRRGAALLLTAAYGFVWFKQGFVRHDAHSLAFFKAAVIAGIAFGWPRRPRLVGLAAVAVLLVAFLGALRPVPWELHRPGDTRRIAGEHVSELRDPEPYIAAQRAELRRLHGLDARTLALLRGRSVHVFPTETSVVWAYPELRWRPLPVFQGYQAYTDDLDDLNAAALIGADAPERVLRSTEFSPFENPGAVRELFCRYREVAATPTWQVLARGASRCGPTRSLAVARATTGTVLRVPAAGPGEAVLVAIRGFEPGLAERVAGLLWKLRDRSVRLDREDEGTRVAVQLADEPVFLRIPRAGDYSGPFAMSRDARTLEVVLAEGGVFRMGDEVREPVEVEFLALPVTEPGRV